MSGGTSEYRRRFSASPGGYLRGDPTGGEQVLLALAVILLIVAVVGGIAIHPLLFLIAVLAILALVAGRR